MTAKQLEARIASLTLEIVSARGEYAKAIKKHGELQQAAEAAKNAQQAAAQKLRAKEDLRTDAENQLAQLKGASE